MELTKSDNRLIGLLFISSILIFINLGGVSISFPIGLYALLRFWNRTNDSLLKKNILCLTMLFIVGVISSILSPITFSSSTLYFLIQFFYWLLLARMIGVLYPYIDKRYLSKCIAWSSLILGFVYLAFHLGSQNSVAFTLVILSPLGIYGFDKPKHKIYYALAVSFIMFFNESRSGLAIMMGEMLFIAVMHVSRKRIKLLLYLSILIIFIFVTTPSIKIYIGNIIEPYNPEMAILLKDPESVQARDKSWIQRQVQVQKGLQIFEEHPIIGVGPNNFRPMVVDIRFSEVNDKVDSNTMAVIAAASNNRSAHNSYINLIAEFGIIGVTLWVLFLIPFYKVIYKNLRNISNFDYIIFICTIGISVYFYTIAALYGTSAWLFYGLIYGCYRKEKRITI